MTKWVMMALLMLTLALPVAAQWEQTSGPEGGRFSTFAANNEIVLATNIDEDLYRYNGSAWAKIGKLSATKMIESGGVFLAVNVDRGIVRSTDDGDTWEETGISRGDGTLAADNAIVYAAAGDTIFKSANNGIDWNVLGTLPLLEIVAVDASGPTIVVAGLTQSFGMELQISTDGGSTWKASTAGLPGSSSLITGVEITASGILVSFVSDGIYRSTDGGASWSDFSNGLDHDSNGRSIILSVQQFGSTLWTTSHECVYRLEDSRWVKVIYQTSAMLTAPSPSWQSDKLYLGTSDGVSRSTLKGEIWEPINQGLRMQEIADLARTGNAIVAATSGGIYRTIDAGASWSKAHWSDVAEFANHLGAIFARLQGYTTLAVYRSTDLGATWEQKVAGLSQSFDRITAIAASDFAVFVGFGDEYGPGGENQPWLYGGIFRSIDNGESWQKTMNGLPTKDGDPVPVIDLAAAGQHVVAVTLAGVYYSNDNGESWQKSGLDLSMNSTIILKQSSGEFYLASGTRVLHSVDNGATWESMPLPIQNNGDSFITDLTFVKNIPIVMVTTHLPGTSDVVKRTFRWTWTVEQWAEITDRFPDGISFGPMLELGQTIYGGTYGHSVWTSPVKYILGEPASVQGGEGSRAGISIAPNPFSNVTTLRFTTNRTGDVRLMVIDALGDEVATIHEGMLAAGEHSLHYDAAAITAGTYFYRLILDGKPIGSGTMVKTR